MKRLFQAFTICILLSSTTTLFGQIEVGLKAGLNLTNFTYTDDLDFGSLTGQEIGSGFESLSEAEFRTGFHAGAYALLDVGALSLQPELLFSQKGVTNYSAAGDEIVLNYLSIPIMLGFQPFDFIHFQIGPEFSFLMSNKFKIDGQDDREIEDWYASTDIGAALGVSFDWPGPGLISLRYVHGLSGVLENDVVTGTQTFNNRNRTIQASLAFPLFSTETVSNE